MQARGTRILVGACLLVGSLGAPSRAAQVTTEYGIDFVTVGDPGNRATDEALDSAPFPGGTQDSLWLSPGLHVGAVDYKYRIAQTELTVGHWMEFVNAYLPHYSGSFVNSAFSSTAIQLSFDLVPSLKPGHSLDEPAVVSFEYAARYANWLTNGKVDEAWAFESGAYDTSTFTTNPDGSTNHQLTHSPGATFWLPTEDEYAKAAYWDPTKDGVGGYWMYPNGSDMPSIPGLPEDGGTTNAGGLFLGYPTAVDAYPDEQSTWGLLNGSGGAREMMETRQVTTHKNVWLWGTDLGLDDTSLFDRLDFRTTGSVSLAGGGVRLVTTIPSPTALPLMSLLVLSARRKRYENSG